MYALMRMDFIACRFYLAIGFGLYLLYAVPSFEGTLGFFVLNVAATVLMALAPIMIHDKYRIESLISLLPPARHQVVVARYVTALLALLAGLSLQYIGGTMLSIWFKTSGFWTLCALQAVLVFLLPPLVIISLYYPCYFQFGLGRGFFAFLILATALIIVLTSPALVAALSGNSKFVIAPDMAQQPERVLVALVDHLAAPLGKWPFFAATAVSGIILVAISLIVSIGLFRRRDF